MVETTAGISLATKDRLQLTVSATDNNSIIQANKRQLPSSVIAVSEDKDSFDQLSSAPPLIFPESLVAELQLFERFLK